MNSNNIQDIITISNTCLGKNYLSDKYLHYLFENYKFHVELSRVNNQVVGFSLVLLLLPQQLDKNLFAPKQWLSNAFGTFKTIGYRKATAVLPQYQKAGIAQELFTKTSQWFARQKIEVEITSVWYSKANQGYIQFIESQGFQQELVIPNYWQKDSQIRQYNCPVCKQPPCKCTGAIYSKRNI